MIEDDGKVTFDCLGTAYKGELPEKRYYGESVSISMSSSCEYRSFQIILREGTQVNSEFLPATN